MQLESLPERVILTDDPLRVKMLAAHHLDNAALIREQGDGLVYLGSYNDQTIALIGTGFDEGAAADCLRESKALGAEELVCIGECVSSSHGYPLRSVILAEGGDRALLRRAQLAATRCGIPVTVDIILPQDKALTEGSGLADNLTGALCGSALECGLALLCILTVTENTVAGEYMEEHERRSRLYAAARLSFETLAGV